MKTKDTEVLLCPTKIDLKVLRKSKRFQCGQEVFQNSKRIELIFNLRSLTEYVPR
jgi:hypothetical protein